MGKSPYTMEDLSKRICAHDGEGVNFLPFWCACTNWITSNCCMNCVHVQ